jgi:hypothetical protein
LLVATEDERLVPGRDMSMITLHHIIDAARRYRPGEIEVHMHEAPQAQALSKEIESAVHERVGQLTLRQFVDAQPADVTTLALTKRV